MIEIIDIISKVQLILDRIGVLDMELNKTSKVTYTIDLVSMVLPQLDEVSQIDLEEV